MLTVGRTAEPDRGDPQTQDYYRQWQSYMGELIQRGVVESGAPLESSGKLVSKDSVSDVEVDEVDIGGFLVIEAESIDAAVEIASRAPHIAIGGQTIVRPMIPVGPSS